MTLLEPGKPLKATLSSGQTHSYPITLASGQFLKVTIHPSVIEMEMAFYEPGGRALSQVDGRPRVTTAFSVTAESSGDYHLEVRPLGENRAGGEYELLIKESRLATAKDRDQIAAETTTMEAAQLLKKSKAEDSRLAINKYVEAASHWKAVGNLPEEANAFMKIGDIHEIFGETKASLAAYNQALILYRKALDRYNECEALTRIGHVYFILKDSEKALSFCSRALALSQSTGNLRGKARATNGIGDAYYAFGNMQQSLEHYQRSLSLCRQLDDSLGQAQALLSLGYDYSDLGEMTKAFDCFNEALAIWRVENEKRWQGITLTAMGRLYTRLGESQMAFNLFKQAQEIIEPIGDQIEAGRILSGIGYIYECLGEKLQALDHYQQALQLFKNTGYLEACADMLYSIGNVFYSMADYQQALNYFQQALAFSITMKDKRERSYALRGIGMVCEAQGNKRKAHELYLKALPFCQSEKDRRGEADTLRLIGQIHAAWGQTGTALAYYERAIALSRSADYRFGEASTLYGMARMTRDLNKLDAARSHIEAALETIEALRTKVLREDLRNAYFASVGQYYEFYIDLLMQLHARHPNAGFDVAAFEASEKARALSLLETLAKARIGVQQQAEPGLLERERLLRQEINTRAANRMRLVNAEHTDKEVAAIEREIEQLTDQQHELEAQIRASGLNDTTLIEPHPSSLKTIQERVLDDGAMLLEYSLGEKRSRLWAVTKTEIRTCELPPGAEIEALANQVREFLMAPQYKEGESFEDRQTRLSQSETNYWQTAGRLSQTLLGPALKRPECKRLIIVADGALQYIPFGALPVPETNGNEPVPLMAGFEVTHQPSASTLVALRDKIAGRQASSNLLMVFADPVFEEDDPRLSPTKAPTSGLRRDESPRAEVYRALRGVDAMQEGQHIPRLFASRDEAEAVRSLIPQSATVMALGFDANKLAASSPDLKQYRILHFATHGILDSHNPDLSGLVLSLYDQHGQPQDGFLRLNDIYQLELSADLVVLSACNTGLGKQIKSEGVIGLTRGFMYAGAARVVASLWRVDDEATAQLIKCFYREMLVGQASPAEALRRAQMTLWHQKRWHSPYFWAGFVLQGEYAGQIHLAEAEPPWILRRVLPIVFVALLLIGLFLLIIRYQVFRSLRKA